MQNTNAISTNVVSHKSLDELESRGHENFTLRPWNHYKPENTLWWLVPSKDWPSYKYGKIAIAKEAESDDFRIGYHFEKGISATAGQMLPSRTAEKLCLKPDWVWNSVSKDIKSGKFTEKLSEISKSLNSPLRLIIQASAIKDKESAVNQFEGLELKNNIEFSFDGNSMRCVDGSSQGEMSFYTHISSVEGLLEIFEAEDMEWYWIDFYVVTKITNAEANEIKQIIPVFIEQYGEFFGR